MTQHDVAPGERFATLFVELTGRHSLEERQHAASDRRVDDTGVAAYVTETARQTGLDDAIADPDDY